MSVRLLAKGERVGSAEMVDGESAVDRTFEAVVFDWDGTAVVDRQADAIELRARVEAMVRAGVHIVVITGTHVDNIDGQLQARPSGPGELYLCVNRGSEVFEVDAAGPHLVWRRIATPEEDAALDRAADLTVTRLESLGLTAKIVSQRLNRRKIDIIPEPGWEDPPKARISELLTAVTARLESHGVTDGLAGAVAMGLAAARDAGLTDPKVTSDAKHVEIGLTDKADSMHWVLARMGELGIGAGLLLIAGDEFGDLGSVTGSDSMMLVPEVARSVAVSVGVEPSGVPEHVLHLGGGPDRFVALLDDQLLRRAQRRVPEIDDDEAWVVHFHDVPDRRRAIESICTLSNGAIGIRGAREEGGEGSEPLTLVTGVYTSQTVPRLLPGPIWPALMVRDGEGSDCWSLDLRSAVLLRERLNTSRVVRTLRFVSLADPEVLAIRAEGPVARLAGGDATREPEHAVSFSRDRFDDGSEVAITRSGSGGGIAIGTATTEAKAGTYRSIERIATWSASDDDVPSVGDVRARTTSAAAIGFDRLLARHRAAWALRWRDAMVKIDGDPECELGIRLAMFHALAGASAREESAVGARALTGNAYSGHVFWDSDVFVLPTLAAIHPEAARAMLEYRIRRLPAARDAARQAGMPGARFPWESAKHGIDVTPRMARGRDGSVIPIRTGTHEEHINADIAWAALQYVRWSGDTAFLHGPGRDLVLDTARWWAARVRFGSDGRGHIYGVIGPDEYHEIVDDNAYTNVMARWHLREAAVLAESAGGADPGEVEAWRRTADALVDGYDKTTGIYEQFAGYSRLESRLIADYAEPPVAADLLLGPAFVRGSQIIKQADVLMLHHMVPDEVAAGSLVPNLDFYGPRTAHGSSLSPAIQASALARAGRVDEALDLFRVASRLDLDDLTSTTAGGVHLATMGGAWQALTAGFLGLRPLPEGLAVDPQFPSGWHAVEASFRYHGGAVEVRATTADITVTTAENLTLLVGPDATPVVTTRGTTTVPLGRNP